jgi:hypothetical protein
MDDPGCWQWVTREETIQSIPVEPTSTIPTRQPFVPDPDDLIGVPAQSAWRARSVRSFLGRVRGSVRPMKLIRQILLTVTWTELKKQ